MSRPLPRAQMGRNLSRCSALAASVAKILALMILLAAVLVIAVVSFSASALFFAICPTLLVFFSPILAPLGILLLLLLGGVALFFGCGVAFVSALVWAYKRRALENSRLGERSQPLRQSTAPTPQPS